MVCTKEAVIHFTHSEGSTLVKQFLTYYFSLQFGRLLKAGMTLQQALTVFENHENIQFMQEESKLIKAELQQGDTFNYVIRARPYFF